MGEKPMRLLLKRGVRENKLLLNRIEYVLWAQFELTDAERDLVRNYELDRSYLTIEGSWHEIRRASLYAIVPTLLLNALVVSALSFLLFLCVFLLSFIGITWLIYEQIRETIKVVDIINGRTFKNKNAMLQIRRERQMVGYALAFKNLLITMQNWSGKDDVIELGDEHEGALRLVTDIHAPA
jgi:hypothetical protein